MEQPEKVDFEVTVMGGSTLSGLIPSLKAWLVGFARDSLISMYVMPEHWTYRLDPVSPSSCFNCSVFSTALCFQLLCAFLFDVPTATWLPNMMHDISVGSILTHLWLVDLLSMALLKD